MLSRFQISELLRAHQIKEEKKITCKHTLWEWMDLWFPIYVKKKRQVVDKINTCPRDQNEWNTTYLKRKENNKCIE